MTLSALTTGLVESIRLRCNVDDCRGIRYDVGDEIYAGASAVGSFDAGDFVVINEVLGVFAQDVDHDASGLALNDVFFITYAPKIVVDFTDGNGGVKGEVVGFNGTAFTTTMTNLARCGYITEDQDETADTAEICFIGDLITPDIVAGS